MCGPCGIPLRFYYQNSLGGLGRMSKVAMQVRGGQLRPRWNNVVLSKLVRLEQILGDMRECPIQLLVKIMKSPGSSGGHQVSSWAIGSKPRGNYLPHFRVF